MRRQGAFLKLMVIKIDCSCQFIFFFIISLQIFSLLMFFFFTMSSNQHLKTLILRGFQKFLVNKLLSLICRIIQQVLGHFVNFTNCHWSWAGYWCVSVVVSGLSVDLNTEHRDAWVGAARPGEGMAACSGACLFPEFLPEHFAMENTCGCAVKTLGGCCVEPSPLLLLCE